MKFDERNKKKKFNPPFFISMATAAKFAKKIGIDWTNFAVVAMETKKGGFKIFLDSFHQTL
jgi:hypothetical protein